MIYTHKGDSGESEIFDGKRFSKDSQIFEVLGALDEVNSLIGICKNKACDFDVSIQDKRLTEILEKIQKDLFEIQSCIAGVEVEIKQSNITQLESDIDFIEKNILELKKFLIADGSELALFLNYTRSVIRRSERRIISLNKEQQLKPEILIYLNRLSDLFFVLYCFVNIKKGYEEKYF